MESIQDINPNFANGIIAYSNSLEDMANEVGSFCFFLKGILQSKESIEIINNEHTLRTIAMELGSYHVDLLGPEYIPALAMDKLFNSRKEGEISKGATNKILSDKMHEHKSNKIHHWESWIPRYNSLTVEERERYHQSYIGCIVLSFAATICGLVKINDDGSTVNLLELFEDNKPDIELPRIVMPTLYEICDVIQPLINKAAAEKKKENDMIEKKVNELTEKLFMRSNQGPVGNA